jgi:hypothetical protein
MLRWVYEDEDYSIAKTAPCYAPTYQERWMRKCHQFALVLLVMSCCLTTEQASARDRGAKVTSAIVGTDGLVHIRRGSGAEFVAPLEKSPVDIETGHDMQVSVEAPVIAEDGRTVGWLVNFPNCCTSYPIPLVLLIYRDGKIIRRITPKVGTPLIFRWSFRRKGSEVAFFSDTLHGDSAPTCELQDVTTGKLLAEWHRGESKSLPDWAEQFAKEIGDSQEQ